METSDPEARIRKAFEAGQLDLAATVALEAYGEELLSFLCARLRSTSDAREVFSIFVEDLWTGLPAFRWQCRARTWAYTLARNAAARYVASPQRDAARHVDLSNVASLSAVVDRLRSATDAYRQTTVKDRFRLLREQLDDDDQMLLILRVDRDMAWRDLAIAMNGDTELDDDTVARETVRLRKAFERVKRTLREMAEREGLLARGD
jgi:RNA polymerase sigma-70 factor, ECF subfamily